MRLTRAYGLLGGTHVLSSTWDKIGVYIVLGGRKGQGVIRSAVQVHRLIPPNWNPTRVLRSPRRRIGPLASIRCVGVRSGAWMVSFNA